MPPRIAFGGLEDCLEGIGLRATEGTHLSNKPMEASGVPLGNCHVNGNFQEERCGTACLEHLRYGTSSQTWCAMLEMCKAQPLSVRFQMRLPTLLLRNSSSPFLRFPGRDMSSMEKYLAGFPDIMCQLWRRDCECPVSVSILLNNSQIDLPAS